VGAQSAPITAQEHLAGAPLTLKVGRVVKRVMPQEQDAKRQNIVNTLEEPHG